MNTMKMKSLLTNQCLKARAMMKINKKRKSRIKLETRKANKNLRVVRNNYIRKKKIKKTERKIVVKQMMTKKINIKMISKMIVIIILILINWKK